MVLFESNIGELNMTTITGKTFKPFKTIVLQENSETFRLWNEIS